MTSRSPDSSGRKKSAMQRRDPFDWRGNGRRSISCVPVGSKIAIASPSLLHGKKP
jgi:hypothetical protein